MYVRMYVCVGLNSGQRAVVKANNAGEKRLCDTLLVEKTNVVWNSTKYEHLNDNKLIFF